MTIYRKDGSIYTISKPNPLMTNQIISEEDWYELHGTMGSEEFVVEYNQHKKNKPPTVKKPTVVIPPPISPPPPLPPPLPDYIEPPKVEEVIETPPEIEGDWYHCLPAKIIEHYDELYDERIRRTVYGDQYTVELRKNSGGDMGVRLVSNQRIDEKSILFSIKERRWWKVAKCIKQDNGIFIILVVPSLEQPSFT